MFINRLSPQILFAEDDSGGSSDPGSDLPNAVVKAFEKLLERKGGDASAVAQMLFQENKSYRDKISELSGKVPTEGAVVLSADEAKEWQAYRALGAVTDIKQGLEQRTQLQGQLDDAKRGETLRTVAEAAGYKPSVLTQLDRMAKAQGKALTFEVRDTQADGKTVAISYVKDGETEHSLADYAAAQWADFLPALAVQGTTQSNGAMTPTPTPGLRFPAQHPGGAAAPTTTKAVADSYVAKSYRRAKQDG